MPRRPAGVLTNAGFLTSQLEALGFTRQDLAYAVGISLRTIHNIEHGRKRVQTSLLRRVADALNERSRALSPITPPLGLTEHHLIAEPRSVADVAMQSIVLNRPDFLLNTGAPVDPSVRWSASGDPDLIPWAGTFDLTALGRQIDGFHRQFARLAIERSQLFVAPQRQSAVVRTTCDLRHPSANSHLRFICYIEFDVTGCRLRAKHSTFDTGRVARFLALGRDGP